MKKGLVVIDVQNDFVDGALGTREAQAIVPNVVDLIENGGFDDVMVTMDTHYDNYMETLEGKKLPVPHCKAGTFGWLLNDKVREALAKLPFSHEVFEKETFGQPKLAEYIRDEKFDEITVVGLCTDICVISNLLIIRAFNPDLIVRVKADCCAGVTPETHEAALKTVQMCQIDVI